MRVVGLDEPGPLPDDPVLAAAAEVLNDAGQRAYIYDASWRLAYMTDDGRRVLGGPTHLAPYTVGEHPFGPEAISSLSWPMEIIRDNARTPRGCTRPTPPSNRRERARRPGGVPASGTA